MRDPSVGVLNTDIISLKSSVYRETSQSRGGRGARTGWPRFWAFVISMMSFLIDHSESDRQTFVQRHLLVSDFRVCRFIKRAAGFTTLVPLHLKHAICT